MNRKHLNTLEFPQILARLARHTSFSAGKALALALQPSPVFVEVQQGLRQTREARYLLDSQGGVSLGGAHDIRPLSENARRGAVLRPAEFLDIRSTLRAGRRAQRMLERLHANVPLLADIAARIEPCDDVADEIDRCINEQAEVVDQASQRLANIRREMRTAHDRLLSKLEGIIANSQNATILQEPLITQRGGRYVIPIKAEAKGRIPGIVHDTSASGATFFIEPLSTVDLGNRWRELQLEEAKEVDRILAELSALVGDNADELGWTVAALAELDLILAKARYANLLEATEPRLSPFGARGRRSGPGSQPSHPGEKHPGSTLELYQARHPLLDPETVVPIDVFLDEGIYALVITGPNTGGKTVSLKTVGLMAAMAQCGLHLPVGEGSALSVFEGIYADIGDEQSIEQSLSTFSSHLTNIVGILKEADDRGLVLLDELGAGTDPVEGSALARSILSHLLARQITTLVATHYSELKVFAHTTPGVENASVEFDLQTLSPTYHMQIGLPGRSNAFAIAERLGLPAGIVATARTLVSPEELEAESLLAEIQEAHREATAARDEALLAQQQVAEEQRRLDARLTAIEGERAAILGEARTEARRLVAEIREEVESLRGEMSEQKDAATLGEQWLAQARERLAKQEEALIPPPKPPEPEDVALPGDISVGDTVFIRGLSTTGEVTALEDDTAEVQVGHFGVRVQRDDLERRSRRKAEKPKPAAPALPAERSVEVEVDLRGLRVEEVLPLLEKYLDDAFLTGMPFVRIVHGKGTGTLRQVVRQELQNHPLVKSYRPGAQGEGGSGVTVAYLAES
ncbi:MAG: endonuclease MutS2 [Anaerolineae bacterium]